MNQLLKELKEYINKANPSFTKYSLTRTIEQFLEKNKVTLYKSEDIVKKIPKSWNIEIRNV